MKIKKRNTNERDNDNNDWEITVSMMIHFRVTNMNF